MEKEQLIANVLAYIDNLYEARPQPPQSRAIFGDNRMGVEEDKAPEAARQLIEGLKEALFRQNIQFGLSMAEPPKERWKPKRGDIYWVIDYEGDPADSRWDEDDLDTDRHSFGNCFPTKEAAEAARDKVKALLLSL